MHRWIRPPRTICPLTAAPPIGTAEMASPSSPSSYALLHAGGSSHSGAFALNDGRAQCRRIQWQRGPLVANPRGHA
eukprot:5086761-Lingulodinium_polyedra.AAC.1